MGYIMIMEKRMEDTIWGLGFKVWEFPKISGTFLGGPYNKDYTI